MKYKRQNEGITLVTLVITVVVMLILAGVAIAQFTGGDGIFSRVTDATREYKKQSMLEAVDLAKAYLEMEKTYKNEPITITDVIDKVKEISSINEEDYIITIDDEEQSATIIDKQTGVVIDIWIDENGEIQVEGSIVDDIENVVKPTITYTLDPPAGTYGEAVKITITATEEKNGIVRMVLPDNSEITYNNEKTVTREYTVTENGTYKFTVEGANGRETTKYVKVDNIMSASEIIMEVQNTNPTNQNVSIKITYDENVKSGGQVLINADRFQYSIGENNWQIATEAETTISVGVNGIVYARYYDGTTGFKTKSITIQNIDREKPVISSATASTSWGATNSVTITATDTGTAECAGKNIGIVGYGINQSSKTEPTYTTVTATTSLNTTIDNITANGTYYVWVKDQAGNTANKAVTVNRVDTTDPTTATIASSNVEETTFTLTATGADGESGIAKYEFYINGTLEKTVTTTAGTATYNVSGKTGGTSYTCKVIVYDNAGNPKESNIITVTTQSLVGKWDGTICTPNVSEGMTKVYWNGSDEIVEGDADYVESEWYAYTEQTGTTEAEGSGTSKWANVKMSDGSYFVWIPRYEYKILSGEGTSTAGEIDINFISTEQTTPTAGYTIHPAFTSSAPNGGGFGEIPGLWVAKFEASQSNATSESSGDSGKIKIQPNVQSWISIKIGDMYTKALNYDTTSINNSEFDSHLMKNSEWGAVAYLAWSKYGRNGTEITMNNSSDSITGNAGNTVSASEASGTTNAWNTSKGMLASTTGNASGIYDMSGGAWEYVAAYVANGNSILSGSSFASTSVTSNSQSTKYVTVYPKGSSDSRENNWNAYKALSNLRGDAMKETASSYSGTTSWNDDCSGFPYSYYPFFKRGGNCNNGSGAGAFYFNNDYGNAGSDSGFRVVGL